jgi:ribosome-associated protein
MKTSPLAKLVVHAIEDIKGLDIKVLDVAALTTITDHMVICTGTSNRHVKSIADNILVKAKAAGHRPIGVEGLDAGEWVLVDLGDVVAHVMQAQTRVFYQLEKLWDVPPAEREPVAKPAKAARAKGAKATRAAKGGKRSKGTPARGGKPRGKSGGKPGGRAKRR